jgi:hypothetical protein
VLLKEPIGLATIPGNSVSYLIIRGMIGHDWKYIDVMRSKSKLNIFIVKTQCHVDILMREMDGEEMRCV